MNIEYTNLEKVLAIILACLATGIWRLIGVIFYNKISHNEKLLTRKYLNIPQDYFCCLFVGRNTESSNRKQFQRNILAFKNKLI